MAETEKRIAILGDIHANLEALQAVMEDARQQGVNEYNCVGDIVGYNANPQECVDIVRAHCTAVVRGNHDHYCSGERSLADFQPNAAIAIEWTHRQLDGDSAAWLSSLPLSKNLFQYSFSLVHGTLDMPDQWGYVFDAVDAGAHFAYQTTPVCFHGHTHVPAVFEKVGSRVDRYAAPEPGMRVSLSFGHKYFINVGSVGQPRDGIPKASYAIYEPRSRIIEFRRVDFDIKAAADKIRRAGLPQRLADRLEIGR
ncbi:MAG: metallophosphoesterase family protein [Kiritimatiellae bacterium]|nr:metallophosphoesterase family protein [Kiritimatiellia bacterium]